MPFYIVYLCLDNALHVWGGNSTHHQVRIQLYISGIPDVVDTVVCATDDGWRYHPKHVEQFPDINKVCNVASYWIYIGIYLQCKDQRTFKNNYHSLLFKLQKGKIRVKSAANCPFIAEGRVTNHEVYTHTPVTNLLLSQQLFSLC